MKVLPSSQNIAIFELVASKVILVLNKFIEKIIIITDTNVRTS